MLGEPVDNLGPIDTRTTSPIHKPALTFIQLDTKLSNRVPGDSQADINSMLAFLQKTKNGNDLVKIDHVFFPFIISIIFLILTI